MQNWSKIPIEVLNIITKYSGRDCKKVKWMFVNKRWFTFYLSEIFSTVKTSLREEPVTNKILNSSFNIGTYVKRIDLSDIYKPSDVNKIDLSNDILCKIIKKTPNVREIRLLRKNKDLKYQDWPYLYVVLTNTNCWKLQFLPALGEEDIVSAAYYYTCAYYLRNTLKKLELSSGMIGSQDFSFLKQFIALETLEIHKGFVNGLNELELFLQFTPNLQELIVRFDTNRIYQPQKKEYTTYPGLKKVWLYNFSPKNNDELLVFANELSSLQNLHIFGERDKIWLSDIDGPLAIDSFFNSINLIPEYKIMMSGDSQENEFSVPWLKSIRSSEQEIYLLHSYAKVSDQNYTSFESNVVATFYSGSEQSAAFLKYTMLGSPSVQETIVKLKVLDYQIVSGFRIEGVNANIETPLKQIIGKERTYLKQMIIFDCKLEVYTYQASTTPQHIKSIIFRSCKIDFTPLKSFIKEFPLLDYVEFDNCTFGGKPNVEYIDMSDTDATSIKMTNFRKMSSSHTYTDQVQTIIAISISFTTSRFFRYFSIVENTLCEITKFTFEIFRNKFNSNEAVILNIKVKSLQELSFMLTEDSKIHSIYFNLQES